MRQFFKGLALGDKPYQHVTRLVTIAGAMWALVQLVDRFFPNWFPTGVVGVALMALSATTAFLAVGWFVTASNAEDDRRTLTATPSGDAKADLAASLVGYATYLAGSSPPRDRALLTFRAWATRLLHLNGSHEAREQVGRLSLAAAAGLGDQMAQASVLIDDLGWSQLEQGKTAEGVENIEEGVAVLEALPEEERNRSEAVELLIKGKRHLMRADFLANSDSKVLDEHLRNLRALAASLPEPRKSLNLAQLDHAEGALLHRWVDKLVGAHRTIDPALNIDAVYSRAVQASSAAEASFARLGDSDRQVKALRVYVDLLRHGAQSSRLATAEARLIRLEEVSSRGGGTVHP